MIITACDGAIHNNVVNLLAAYADADPEVQDRIDDFMTISPFAAQYISRMTAIWERLAVQIWTHATDLHVKLKSQQNIVDILTRSHLNAHNFYTGHVMLEIGSKFNHSCAPNATYNKFVDPATGTQYMRIFTIRPIMKGEQIFSTYIGGLDMLKSTRDRRQQLAEAKAFWCRCSRCVAPDILAPLPCPTCRKECLRYDDIEYPWRCEGSTEYPGCGRRWWDSEIIQRETQIGRVITAFNNDMNIGRFPPVQTVQFVVRDALEDLGPKHYLAVQGRLLLEESFAFREITGILEEEEVASRIANAWVYIQFLMSVVWNISPVVATNLCVLRIRTLLGHNEHFPPGVPKDLLKQILIRSDAFLRSFWGQEDQDAAMIRSALMNEKKCQNCHKELRTTLEVCGSCANAQYCSRECCVASKSTHQANCNRARDVASILRSELAF